MNKKEKKNRLDEEVVNRKLTENLKQAQAYIMAGEILVRGQVEYSADVKIPLNWEITIKQKSPYVSRGGYKIQTAFENFCIDVMGINVVDIGISTGGFADFVLQNGASKVMGVDVNIDQVDYQLRKDPRLTLLQKNARYLVPADIPFNPDLIIIDVSFISITKILSALKPFKNSRILALIKPQFEARKENVGAGGIINDDQVVGEIMDNFKEKVTELGFSILGFTAAGLKGRKGNQEYFFLLESSK